MLRARNITLIVVVIAAFLAAVGCRSSGNNLIGTWQLRGVAVGTTFGAVFAPCPPGLAVYPCNGTETLAFDNSNRYAFGYLNEFGQIIVGEGSFSRSGSTITFVGGPLSGNTVNFRITGSRMEIVGIDVNFDGSATLYSFDFIRLSN
jgi:hypothetical protein